MLADWLILLRLSLCLCLCLCQHVLTRHYSNINISISLRRTQRFDIMLMLMLMSWLSSLAHKLLLWLCLCLYLCLCLRRYWGPDCPSSLVHGRPSLPLYHNYVSPQSSSISLALESPLVSFVSFSCAAAWPPLFGQQVCVFPFDVVFERDAISVGLWTAFYSTENEKIRITGVLSNKIVLNWTQRLQW